LSHATAAKISPTGSIAVPPATESSSIETPPEPQTVARTGHLIPKLIHLQVLRAFAASLVVADHTFPDLVQRGVHAEPYRHAGFLIGHLGVTAFFVLSGLIMMRQSANLFGTLRGPLIFAYRRILRIVPMYWIATACTLLFSLNHTILHPIEETLLSLFFIPDFVNPIDRLEPLLGQGWTLNYEMFFYLLFAISLLLPRKTGILFLLIVPEMLAAIGRAFHFPLAGPASSLANFYTDQLILLFGRGVLIGAWESESRTLPVLKIPFSPAYLLLVPALLFFAMPYRIGQFESWELLSLYSILVVLCCTLVPNGTPGPILRGLVLLGDASYSTYLFHLFAYPLILPLFIRIWGRPHSSVFILAAMLACVAAANILGLAIHLVVERPLTKFLKTLPIRSLKALGTSAA